MAERDWKWFGHAAHLCVARWCLFHLATEVNGYLISTVGDYQAPMGGEENAPRAEIGYKRFFETMVFKAGIPCTAKDCDCGLPDLASGEELEAAGYQTAGEAAAGHIAMCKKYDEGAA